MIKKNVGRAVITSIVLGVLPAAAIFSCSSHDEAYHTKPNPIKEHQVKLYFEVDGCKVYQFRCESDGRRKYFSTCPGIISSNHLSGKIHVEETISTSVKPRSK